MPLEQLRKARLREIPQVNNILQHQELLELSKQIPPQRITEGVQKVVASLRQHILETTEIDDLKQELDSEEIVGKVLTLLREEFSPSLKRVINATGIVLHTNCGRSVLPKEVMEFVSQCAEGYSNLELDLQTGERGSRYQHIERLLCKLTGAEAALVVNNNAAAVLLVMKALAFGKEVIVSRGELVEVGGSFRIPEVLRAGGASLIEVGTTNKTWLADYQNSINENTAVLLKVHTSNFRVVGFTHQVSSEELVKLGEEKGLPVVEDLGSGTLLDFSEFGLPQEPTIQTVVSSGVDVVTFSGDKLLGGPQAGVILGKKLYIERIKRDQLTRALRVDKLTLAALEAVLRMYFENRHLQLPALKMLCAPLDELKARAVVLAQELQNVVVGIAKVSVIEGFSQAGGGALPTADLRTFLVAVEPLDGKVNQLEAYLRSAEVPVLARIQKERLLLDVRTLLEGDGVKLVSQFGAWAHSN